MLLGRKTYQGFAEVWPEQEEAGGDEAVFAKQVGDARKVVVSHQQLTFSWRNSEQLQGDLVTAVTALKNEPGGVIGMGGSVSIVRQLLDAGLLDELHLLVHPVAVRTGLRLFDESGTALPLKLLKSGSFRNGVLYLVYGPDEAPPQGTYQDAVEAHRPGPAAVAVPGVGWPAAARSGHPPRRLDRALYTGAIPA